MKNSKVDIQKILNGIRQDEARNRDFLHLTANEAQMSETARTFLSSKLNERYYFGGGNKNSIVDFGHVTALGIKSVEDLLQSAKEAARKMLGAADVNLNVLSGVHAMMSALLATSEPGDTIMTVPTEYGGHFATVGILQKTGRNQIFLDFDYKNLCFDVAKIAEKVKKFNVKVIYLDVSYYLNPHNLRELRQAIGPEVIIIYDASHTMGLIMGQQFQNPFLEGADIITANTHKTLPGPHKGMIVFKDKFLADKANAIIDGCLYSSPHMIHLVPLAMTLLELKAFGCEYARQVIANSNALAEAFVGLRYEVRKANTGRYSENHQVHVYIDTMGNYMDLYKKLVKNNISTNFEGAELTEHRWYIRFGTQEVTRRGMKEADMSTVTSLVDRALKGENVQDQVKVFNQRFNKIHYSFDKS
jgi:glycine/serine hydroxymethyltransferase